MVIFYSYVSLPEGIIDYIILYIYIYTNICLQVGRGQTLPIQQPDWSLLELLEFHLRHLRPMMKNLELFHVIYDPWFFYDNCHCFWGTYGYIYIYIMIYYYSHVWTNLCIIYIYILLYITVSYYILLYMMIYHYILYIVYIIIILSVINCYKSHDDHPTGGVPKKNAQSGFH